MFLITPRLKLVPEFLVEVAGSCFVVSSGILKDSVVVVVACVVAVVEMVVVGVVVMVLRTLMLLVSIGQQIFGTSLANPHVKLSKNFLFSFVIGFPKKSPKKLIKVKSLIS